MRCQNCGAENPNNKSYCGDCGVRISSIDVSNTTTRCTECGATNSSGDHACQECGRPIQHTWSKAYGIPGFWEGSVSDGPNGATVKTRFSLGGFEEVSKYPRWMIGGMWAALVVLMLIMVVFLGAVAFYQQRLDVAGVSLLLLVAALLTGYLAHRHYYRPP